MWGVYLKATLNSHNWKKPIGDTLRLAIYLLKKPSSSKFDLTAHVHSNFIQCLLFVPKLIYGFLKRFLDQNNDVSDMLASLVFDGKVI